MSDRPLGFLYTSDTMNFAIIIRNRRYDAHYSASCPPYRNENKCNFVIDVQTFIGNSRLLLQNRHYCSNGRLVEREELWPWREREVSHYVWTLVDRVSIGPWPIIIFIYLLSFTYHIFTFLLLSIFPVNDFPGNSSRIVTGIYLLSKKILKI